MPAIESNREGLVPEPFWYKSGVIYELHVRAFYDSDDNGVGDFRGLTLKLDYLRDLGVTALWLLPFYPSPLKDDGYDIADYFDVHPMYGTLADFKQFLREAHRRNLRVITELVMNHTSDQHPWFQRARRAKPGSRWRNFYVWNDSPEKFKDARIIFKDVEFSNWSWDPLADSYYWHRFFSHQPDLNYDNPEVFEQMVKVLDFWLDLGVDGLRLDAVPYLYEREGTTCENLPETHQALKQLRAHVDSKYSDRMLLGEANQWPEDAVAYFGQGRGDECHMAFHFPLMPRLFMALRMEDRTPIVDILEQTPAIPETCQWALFLRNHDELTLEMVTDEERDYMYRMYAHVHQARLNLGIRRRLGPLLGNDRKRIELLNALLMSLPGTPVLYYGDEIGMGDNIFLGDRNGVRTPMQWSSDKNAGFSRANPQSLYLPIIYDPEYHYEAMNVEAQLQNPHSLQWWMRRLLALRKRWRALGEGRCEFVQCQNRKILSYVLRHEKENILVVANLSRFVQPLELDLRAFTGCLPIELFGRTPFPIISDDSYFLTLSPHAFFWFALEPKAVSATSTSEPGVEAKLPVIAVAGDWTLVLTGRSRLQFETALLNWLPEQGWFSGKKRVITRINVRESIPLSGDSEHVLSSLIEVEFAEGDSDTYTLPLAFITGDRAEMLRKTAAQLVICELVLSGGVTGVLCDAIASTDYCRRLLELIATSHQGKLEKGELIAWHTEAFPRIVGEGPMLVPTLARAPQSNSSIIYGDKLILKLFRRLDPGVNPDLELSRFLYAQNFPHTPQFAGAIEFSRPRQEPLTLGIANAYLPQARNAWNYTLDALGRFYERVGTLGAQNPAPLIESPLALPELSKATTEIVGTFLDSARLLGERTAEFHLVMASAADDATFAPETVTSHYARGLLQSMRNQLKENFGLLRDHSKKTQEGDAALAARVLELEPEILRRFRLLYERRVSAKRIRCHGDFHLGQVLYTGKDFALIDFEGEPSLPLSERRLKRSPLRDVAAMMRSFHYVARAGVHEHAQRGSVERERLPQFEPWMRLWQRAVSGVFLRAYLGKVQPSEILPSSPDDLRVMLLAYLLNKAVYEVGYELENRPDWLHIPLRGILDLLELENRPTA